ncbi:MAG: hypothetical protein AAF614_26065 [Chloroflexota bacterium]
MKKVFVASVSAFLLLGWLLVITAVAQDESQVEITAVTTAATPVQVGQDVHIAVTYTVVGTQTITSTQPSPYTIDVAVLDDMSNAVASCREPLNGILGLSSGADNTYTCSVIIPRAGNFKVSAEILGSGTIVVTPTQSISGTNALTTTTSLTNTNGLTATSGLSTTTGLTLLSQSTSKSNLVVEADEGVLSNGVIQLFAGLAIFSAVMLIVAVGTETIIDSVKVAFGLKNKVTTLDALNQLHTLLPGQLEGLGVDKESQKQVDRLLQDVKSIVKPTLQLPDLTKAIAEGDINKFVETLQNMAPQATAVQTFASDIQNFIDSANKQFDTLKTPTVKMLDSLIAGFKQVLSDQTIATAVAPLSLNGAVTELTDIETKLQAIQIDPDNINNTLQEAYGLIAQMTKAMNDFLNKLHGWGDKQTNDWLKQKRDTLLQQSTQTVEDDFETELVPILNNFSFLDPGLTIDAQQAVNNFLAKVDGVAKSKTDLYLRSVDNLLHGVEIRRFHTQSPLRKLWRRLRKAGALYGLAFVWGLFALGFALASHILRPFLTCTDPTSWALGCLLKSEPTLLGVSGALSLAIIIVMAVAGFFIYRVKHTMPAPAYAQPQKLVAAAKLAPKADSPPKTDGSAKAKTAAKIEIATKVETAVSNTTTTDTKTSATQGTPLPGAPTATPTPTMRQRLLPWFHWLFGKPHAPTILAYMEIFWNWLHGKTELDPATYGLPPTLDKMIARTIADSDEMVHEISTMLTSENLAQVVLLRTNQQEDEEKTRKRLMRVLAMFVGTALAYFLQIDAAVLLDKALPGTSGLVNGLFVIQGSFLHKHWAFLPATLNITPGIVLTGLAASAGSAFWHDQLERLQAAKQVAKSAAGVLQQAQNAIGNNNNN